MLSLLNPEDYMKYELKKLSFGEILGQSFNLYLENFPLLFVIALISAAASYLPAIVVLFTFGGPTEFSPVFSVLLTLLFTIPATAVIYALYIEILSRLYLEKPIVWNKIRGRLTKLIIPIILLTIVVSILAGLAALLLVIPGIIVWMNYSLATTVMVIEDASISDSMKRSKYLIKGSRWKMFGLIIIVSIVGQLLSGLASYIPTFSSIIVSSIITIIFNAIATPFSLFIYVLMYFNCRIEKEGFALEHLAEAFALESDNP